MVEIEIRQADDERVWWLGRLPFAWGAVAVTALVQVPVALWYADQPWWALVIALWTTGLVGFGLRGVWDAHRPLLGGRCLRCGHREYDVDPQRVRRLIERHHLHEHLGE